MHARTLPFLLAAPLLLLAGCSEPASEASPPAAAPPVVAADPLPDLVVHQKEGHLDAGAGASTPAATCWAEVGADRILEFDVPEGTAVLVLELAWEDAVQDLTMVSRSPSSPSSPCSPAEGDADGWTAAPDSPASYVVTAPAPGRWTLGAQANGVVAQTIQYTLYASVSAVPLAPDYTAILDA